MNKQEFASKVAITTDSGDVRPNVYIDWDFENGTSVEDTADRVKKILEQNVPEIDSGAIMDYDRIKDYLTVRLYHKSTSAEVAKSASEYGFDDLIIVPYISGIKISDDATGCIKVTKVLTERWRISDEDIFAKAFENAEKNVVIKTLGELTEELSGGEIPNLGEAIDMPYVVTNNQRINGAISVLFCKEKLQERFPDGYTVIPSSIHECMIMPYMGNVDSMVQEVNKQELKPQDVLSDHAYYFADVA